MTSLRRLSAASRNPLDPDTLLARFLDFDFGAAGTVFADTAGATAITDATGIARIDCKVSGTSLLQATAGSRPTYSTSKGGIATFDGTADTLAKADFTYDSDEYTKLRSSTLTAVAWVLADAYALSTNTSRTVWHFGGATTGTQAHVDLRDQSDVEYLRWRFVKQADGNGTTIQPTVGTCLGDAGAWLMLAAQYGPLVGTNYEWVLSIVPGWSQRTYTSNTIKTTAAEAGTLELGANTGASFWDGQIKRVMFLDDALTPEQLQRLYAYAVEEWGLKS